MRASVQATTAGKACGRRRSSSRSPGARAIGQRVTPRFFCPPPLAVGAEITLTPDAAHHVLRVLRLREGAAVTLFDGAGGEYGGELARASPRAVAVRVLEQRDIERESPLAVTLVQGLAAADRMDYAVQKAAELGVAAIVPVVATRSVVRLDGVRASRRAARWRQIIIAACEQSGRNRLPEVHAPCALGSWLRTPSAAQLRVLLAPDAADGLGDLTRPVGTVELLVGPEGGLTVEESAAARAVGFRPVRLGPRILRTESAGPAMLAAINALWGDWR